MVSQPSTSFRATWQRKLNSLILSSRYDIPILESQDGLCRLAIFGPLDLVEYMQWYDFTAQPGGELV